MRKKLSREERLFCHYLSVLRNFREAAARAGLPGGPEEAAEAYSSRKEIRQEVKKSRDNRFPEGEAADGLRRLAFGCVADAVKLIVRDDVPTDEEIEKMDLFNVAEIKRPKGGGMEIKFFDRYKPLEKLLELDEGGSSGAVSFFEALEKSARSIGDAEKGEFDQ